MITDPTLDAWKRWLTYQATDAALAGIPIALRGTEEGKSYPGIYLESDATSRVESGGVQDSNVFLVEWETKLVTTPGDDAQAATSKVEHDILRNALSPHISNTLAESWMDGQIGIRCFQLLANTPETTEDNGYRVTSWKISAIVCDK